MFDGKGLLLIVQ